MKTFIKNLNLLDLFLLVLAVLGNTLASPAYYWMIAPWIGISCTLLFLRRHPSIWGFSLIYVLGVVSSLWTSKDVMPLPFEAIITLTLILNVVGLVPYLLDALLYKNIKDMGASLIFPTAMVVLDAILAQGPQGTWGNIAYTQFHFSPFIQLVTLTGIWGIGFMIYWFASVLANVSLGEKKWLAYRREMLTFLGLFSLCMGYGTFKLSQSNTQHEVTIATITMDNMDVGKSMYLATYDSLPNLPEVLQQNSPELQELMKGFGAFSKDPLLDKYAPVYHAMDQVLAKYLKESERVVKEGANLITWSEGAILNTKNNEEKIKNIGREFTAANNCYLFMPVAIFYPEKVGKEKLYIENKIWTFTPQGELINEYFKNIPVMGVEPSFPGDGEIPVIETPYGRIAQAICYDLDFPTMMRQLGQKQADLIMVPTGDWQGIAPYHTYMGIIRGIENGVGMAKAVSNGLSSVSNENGRIMAKNSFFDEEKIHTIIHTMEIGHSPTFYSKLGDWVVTASQLILLILCVFGLKNWWQTRNIPLKKKNQ